MRCALHWTTPLVLAFYSPEGRYITKLSSLKELCEVHPDTSRRPEAEPPLEWAGVDRPFSDDEIRALERVTA